MATHARHQQSPGAPGAAKRYQVQVYTPSMMISRNRGTRTHFQRQMTMDQTPKKCVGVAKVAELDSEAQVSLIGERPTICCYSEYKQTPRNRSTSCGPSSRSSVSTAHARADAHRRPFPPSRSSPSSASLPPSYHPPPTLAVTANAAWTLLNPSLSGRIPPSILTPVRVGLG